MYGEGKWHQVPLRAGLNRCRKSCRLRWLNYLKPNIKRGEFVADEIDLMIRLHKLLGNRWSLIAARLPGRTSNDKLKPEAPKIAKHNVIKPRPRTFCKDLTWLRPKVTVLENVQVQLKDNISNKLPSPITVDQAALENDDIKRWETLLEEKVDDGGSTYCSTSGEHNISLGDGGSAYCSEHNTSLCAASEAGCYNAGEVGQCQWSDISFDADLWNIL
ncbi:hypothetical protein CICLE_v10013828mg [Citrus x clementina]|uniref:HTH myb-type domain-containing protein n=2 Tax=Citrus TaxID=2706 RepID=V4T2W2_CITCL|nr:hypothetical protein CICLE_v10013828mg [Citrus x clementina]